MNTSTKATLASAMVVSALGSTADALPPSSWTDGLIPANQIFYAGGDSDAVPAVYAAVAQLLNPSSIDVYTDGTGTAKHPQSLNYLVISGVLNRAEGSLASGAAVGFIYKYNGDSLTNGVLPQATPASILLYPSPASLATGVASGPVANAGPYPSPLNPDFVYVADNTSAQAPDWGLADEEEAIFNFPFNLNGVNASRPLTLSGHTRRLYLQPFGVAVTAALYAHKTIWSRGEIADVLAGSILQWSQLNDDHQNALPASLGQVTLIEGGSGAGTKVCGNQFFLNYPSGPYVIPNSVSLLLPGNTFPNGGYTGPLNVAFPTTATEIQDVREVSTPAEVKDLLAANTAGIGALAIVGLEYPPLYEQNNVASNDYVFLGIDGLFPDSDSGADNINTAVAGSTEYSNVVIGKYTFACQTSFNYRVSSTSALPAFQAAVFNNLASSNISGAHTGLAFPGSAPGVLLDPVTNPISTGSVNWSRHGASGAPPTFVATVPFGVDPL